MASTLLLDTAAWDLVLDASGDIALATEPYSFAQDAASAIKTFLGECYWDTTVGLPYMTQILGKTPTVGLLKAQFIAAAFTVPGVVSAKAFITSLSNRGVAGQVQVVGSSLPAALANFAVVDPQV